MSLLPREFFTGAEAKRSFAQMLFCLTFFYEKVGYKKAGAGSSVASVIGSTPRRRRRRLGS